MASPVLERSVSETLAQETGLDRVEMRRYLDENDAALLNRTRPNPGSTATILDIITSNSLDSAKTSLLTDLLQSGDLPSWVENLFRDTRCWNSREQRFDGVPNWEDLARDIREAATTENSSPAAQDGVTIFIAAERGDVEAIEALIQARADINEKQIDGCSPIYVAASHGQVGVLRILIQANADLHATNNEGTTPICIAAQQGHVEAIKVLIQANANPDAKMNDGCSPMYMAAKEGQLEAVKILMEAGADIDAQGMGGWAPLTLAAYCGEGGHPEMVSLLLEHSANINTTIQSGQTAIMLAEMQGHTACVELLRRAAAS